MVADSTPEFYIEHLKRLRENEIQPYFVLGHVHQLEIIERLIRPGVYMGPMNVALAATAAADGPQSLRLDGDASPHAARRVHCHFLEQHGGNIAIQNLAMILGPMSGSASRTTSGSAKERWTTVKQIEWAVENVPSSSAARSRPPTRRAR